MTRQPVYQHSQTSYIWFGLVVLLAGVIALALATSEAEGSVELVVGLAVMVVVALVAMAFARLTTTVTQEAVRVEFTWGWPRRTIPRADIVSHHIVRNHWYYGWGIRWIPHGMLWNVSGLEAVELMLVGGRRFRIGSDEPERLDAALSAVGIPPSGP